jgi:hypothetical protein
VGETTTGPAAVRVAEGAFGVLDGYDIPIITADWTNGLIVSMSIGALIHTGINRGQVNVRVDIRSDPPDSIDQGPWDDIVEASIHSAQGQLRIQSLEPGTPSGHVDLPLLSPNGPGDYRLRAHTRGRDTQLDGVQEDPSEEYLLVIWPADTQATIIIRATDRCGYGLRLASLNTPPPTTPSSATPQPDRSAQRNALLNASTRDRRVSGDRSTGQ